MPDDLVERLGNDATRLTLRLWQAYHLAVEIENCERAIAEYARAGISGSIHDLEHHRMRDDAMAKLKEHLSCLALSPEAADRITTLTARLAELERATPEEVVEMAAEALRNTPLMVPGTLFDLLCTTTYANDHVIALLLKDAAANVISAIAAPLRAQEREACAQIADSFTCGLCGMDGQIAARIRAGGSGG